jgi:hypothetical protein
MTDSENLDRAVALIRNGKPVPAGVRVSAMRAARARGVRSRPPSCSPPRRVAGGRTTTPPGAGPASARGADHHGEELDPTGRKPPTQPKVKSLTPRPAQPKAKPIRLAMRDPRSRSR